MKHEDALKALASVLPTIGTDPAGRSAFAQTIVESIDINRLTLDFFSTFMPTRQLQVGDSLVKKVKNRGLPVRTMVPGTEHLADQLPTPYEVMNFALATIIAKVRYNSVELRRGELYTVADLRRELQDALIDELVRRVFTLIGTTWTAANTPDNFVQVTGSVTEVALEAMIEQVLTKAGGVKAIVGTRKALQPIYKFAGLVEIPTLSNGSTSANPNLIPIMGILEQWRRTGRVTEFRGIPLVELPQVYERSQANFNKPLISDSQIQVIGDNAGEVVLYGGVEFQEHFDTRVEPADYSLAAWRSWAMIIDQPENIALIKLV